MGSLNPQQQAFKEAYCNPNSPTFANALQSALTVGYSQEYSESITAKDNEWMAELVGDVEMLKDAEKALKEAMSYDVKNGGKKVDVGVAGIKLKAATFTSETLGKEKYSKRSELTGKGGESLRNNSLDFLSPEAKDEMRLIYEADMKKHLTKAP